MSEPDIYNYLLTPAAVGGVGISGAGGSVAHYLNVMRAWKGVKPKWVVPAVTKPSLRIIPNYGQWKDRLKRVGLKLEGRHKEEFEGLLARTWGLREADITGKVEVSWEEEEIIPARYPSLANPPLPRGGELWDLDHVPVLLRGPLKSQAMEDGTWRGWIKEECRQIAEYCYRRMTSTVFNIYMLDYWKVPDYQIENEILGPAHEEMVVLQKSEGGKVRPVVKTGNRINRKMDFLSEIVERGLYGSRVSTLFAGAQGNEDIDMMWAREVRNPDSLKVPLDQGGFDQHQSLPTIKAVLTAIGDVCVSATRPGSDYRRVWEVLWYSLLGRRVEVRLGGESFTWGNGIPSGWRWTALFDTLLNYCSLKVIQGITQVHVGRGIPLGNVTVQGDDVMMTMMNLEDAAEIIAGYGDAGYEVHPSKTFFSRERGEFLRRSYEPGMITGYITRTQLAIRFRNPVLEMPVSKEERAASRAALWILFRNRGADARQVAECMVEDLIQSGMSEPDIYNYLLTPAAVGGVGISAVTKPSLRIIPNYGQWKDRLKRVGLKLEGRHKEEFEGLLARTWGLREADITGKVEVSWEEEEIIPARYPSLANPPLPRGGELWDLDHVPVLLRGPLKSQAMEDGTWRGWIKEECRQIAEYCYRRMTSTVFNIYMLDYWKVPDYQIENEILGPAHEEMVVLQKSEGGKVRPVVKTGNRINRKMDFLSEIVERGLYGSRVSTLFAGAQGNEDIDMMWAREVRNPDSLKVPLDQGGFDQHQSLPTIKAVLTAIGDVCVSATRPGSDYRRVWEVLWYSLLGRRVEVRLGGESFTWGNGIPSGWRWTALFDTLLNYCSLKVIQGITQVRVGRGIPLGNVTVQGDDVMMTMMNLEDAAEIIAGYGDAGYEVHPSKTFFSRERGEFLRRSYEPGMITGYITRTQLAIRFRNPVLEMPVSKEERAASRAALWILFRNRGADARQVAECMVEDLIQSGMSEPDIYNYLLTPAAVGGVGITGAGGSVAHYLNVMRAWKGVKPKWVVPAVTKPSLRIIPNYGQWKDRLKRVGLKLEGRHKEEFEGLLARTWGLREADITGKVEVSWEEEEIIPARYPSLANPPLPRGGELWDLDHVPVLLRGPLKSQAMEDGTWRGWIKEECRQIAEYCYRRMTSTVFNIYMLDYWKIRLTNLPLRTTLQLHQILFVPLLPK
ncbi:hypothetical protein ACJJTC_001317 [Scirpophaga incertulas]